MQRGAYYTLRTPSRWDGPPCILTRHQCYMFTHTCLLVLFSSQQTGSVWVGSKFAMLLTSAPVLPTMASRWAESARTTQPRPVSRRHTHAHAQAQCYIWSMSVNVCIGCFGWAWQLLVLCWYIRCVFIATLFQFAGCTRRWRGVHRLFCRRLGSSYWQRRRLGWIPVPWRHRWVISVSITSSLHCMCIHATNLHAALCEVVNIQQYCSFILHQSNMCFNVFLMHKNDE